VNDLLQTTIESTGATVVFGLLLLFLFASVICVVMFTMLLVRAVWRWLTRHTWNDVIVSTERKALRGKP
jgi:hypothetical protein